MRKALLYPWIKIWNNPIDTLQYMLKEMHPINLMLLWFSGIFLNAFYAELYVSSDDIGLWVYILAGVIVTFIDILTISVLINIFGGKNVNFKEGMVLVLLSFIPMLVANIILYIDSTIFSLPSVVLYVWSIVLLVKFIKASGLTLWKSISIVFIYMILFVLLLVRTSTIKDHSSSSPIDLNATACLSKIDQLREQENTKENINQTVAYVSRGYDVVVDNKQKFKTYNDAILQRFFNDSWRDKSMQTSSEQWINLQDKKNLSEEGFDTFIEQLEYLDTLAEDEENLTSILAYTMANQYIDFMDKVLQKLLKSNVEVPLVTLYNTKSETIEDINSSRNYFISNIYLKISDYCDDAQNIACYAEGYSQKAVETSALNPNALHMQGYLTEDKKLEIKSLDRLLLLIKKSDALFDYSLDAVYNNLGYAIYSDSQKERYDEALKYLRKAYELNHDSVYSLASMSSIYMERGEEKNAYEVLKGEANVFFHTSDETLEEKPSTYWNFVRNLMSTSFEFEDYNTTKYVCDKYLKMIDPDYEDCKEYLTKIAKKDLRHIKPHYSFWKLWTKHSDILNEQDPSKEEKYGK